MQGASESKWILGQRPGFFWVALGILLFLVGTLWFRLISRPESLEQAARRCVSLVERGDAERLLPYIRDDEKESLQLDELRLKDLLVNFWGKSISGFKRAAVDQLETFDVPLE